MNSHTFGASLFALIAASSALAAPIAITNNSVATVNDATAGLTALDLTGVVTGLTSSNSLSVNFATASYTGTLTATVFGNVATPGGSLSDVVIVYEFVGNGPSGIEEFMFGQPGGANIGIADLAAATHGSIDELTSPGQTLGGVTLFDNSAIPAGDLFVFDFDSNRLGGVGQTDTFGWYVRTTGDIQIGLSKVLVTNFGGVVIDMLSIVDVAGQPDLNVVPLPTGVGLGIAGLMIVAGRRRRSNA